MSLQISKDFFSTVRMEVQKFCENKVNQFESIKNQDIQTRVIAKTMAITWIISFFVGKQFGNKAKQVSIVAVALYLGSTILDRVSNPQYRATLIFNYNLMKGVEGAKSLTGNTLTQAKRTLEDFTTFNTQDAQKQKKKRAVEDIQTQLDRFFKSVVEEVKFTAQI